MTTHICFHGIGLCEREREPGESGYWMSTDTFLGVLDSLSERTDVRLSFDDGNRSDVDIALPALEARGLTATFFALAGRLDDPASLSQGDLRDLVARGMSVGNHGWSHVPWRGLDAVGVQRELVDARIRLEEASGAPISEAAFPLGRYDRTLLRQLKPLDYRSVYSSDRFPAREDAWLQARYSVTSKDTAATVAGMGIDRFTAREARNRLASAVKRLR